MKEKPGHKSEIVTFIIDELSIIKGHGFAEPIVSKGNGSTTIDWLHIDIALEVEIDWRDLDVFVLLVRLENGKLPQGYYVSEGKPCRFHLQKVITDRKWVVDQNSFKAIMPDKKGTKQTKQFSPQAMKSRFQMYVDEIKQRYGII